MLTPRTEAILATLTGMIFGVSCVGIVVAVRDEPLGSTPSNLASTPPVTPPSPDPGRPLDPAAVQYLPQSVDTGTDGEITVQAPTGWTYAKQGGQARFDHPSGVWMLRLDPTPPRRDVDDLLAAKEKSLRRTPDLVVLRRDRGTREPGRQHRTLVYRYTNDDRGTRLVLSRWISVSGDDRTAVEITVAGRPDDIAGLEAVLARATESLVLP